MSEEQWRPIIVTEGRYAVSDHGSVRLERLGRLVLGSVDAEGYRKFMFKIDGARTHHYLHRLVAEAFLPNPDELPLVRHLDDNKSNNTVGNLAWGTHSDNRNDSVRNGTHWNASKTHCARDHPYDIENTYIKPNGKRECRKCRTQKRAA